MYAPRSAAFYLIPFLLLAASCVDQKDSQEGYKAGFRVIHAVDSNRIYRASSPGNDYLHYRPIDIDLWYPSVINSTDSPMHFKDFLVLFENRANYYMGSNAATGFSTVLAKSFCEAFKCSDTTSLFRLRTSSFENANPAKGKFPVVIYFASYNGMGYENYALLEKLAESGFVIISISSIGRYPGDMTMKEADMLEQVNDAVFAISHLSETSYLDLSRVGILGYSWGGLAGAVAAGKIPNVTHLVSFEGSEFHHYGQNKNEDADFEGIRLNKSFHNIPLALAYFRLESKQSSENITYDSVYNFSENVSGTKNILGIDSADHQDFSSIRSAVQNSGGCATGKVYQNICTLTLTYFQKNFKGH